MWRRFVVIRLFRSFSEMVWEQFWTVIARCVIIIAAAIRQSWAWMARIVCEMIVGCGKRMMTFAPWTPFTGLIIIDTRWISWRRICWMNTIYFGCRRLTDILRHRATVWGRFIVRIRSLRYTKIRTWIVKQNNQFSTFSIKMATLCSNYHCLLFQCWCLELGSLLRSHCDHSDSIVHRHYSDLDCRLFLIA